jgi:hypothetical protein
MEENCVQQYVPLGEWQLQAKSAHLKDSIPGGDESTEQDQVGGGIQFFRAEGCLDDKIHRPMYAVYV